MKKYITTPEFNTLAADVFNARLAQENLVMKTIFDYVVSSLDSKIANNKTKNESNENELRNLKTFDLGYFIDKSRFEEDGAQNYLVFQPIKRYFKIEKIYRYFKMENISHHLKDDLKDYLTKVLHLMLPLIILTPLIDYYGSKVRVKFNKGCLKQPNKLAFDYGRKVNIYIIYELGASSSNDNNPTLKNCLFRAVTLTKNADIEKYGYSGYGIGFDRRGSFSFPGGGFGQNVLIFGADMSSSVHVNNKKKDILILGKGPTQGLEYTLTAEKNIFE